MALTPDEQAELDYVNQSLKDLEDEKKGHAAVDTFKSTTQAQPPAEQSAAKRPFSIKRVVLGGIRDVFQDASDALDSIDEASDKFFGLPSLVFGGKASNGIIGFEQDNPAKATVNIPNLKGSEDAGTAETLARTLVSFTVPFTAALKATSGLRALPLIGRVTAAAEGAEAAAPEFTTLGRIAHGAVAGAIADFQQSDPVGGNMANVLKDTFGLNNGMIESLAAEPDDSELVTRLKAAAAGAPIGIAGDAIFETGAKALRAYRAWKGTMAENVALVESHKLGNVSLDAAHAAEDTSAPATKKVLTQGLKGTVGTVNVSPDSFHSLDDVLGFLKKQAGDIAMHPDDLQRFAANLAEGDPENALAKIGIDPAKLDFSVYRDPEALARLHTGLAEVYEGLANKLGRTGEAVTEKETIRAAEAMASTPEVLRNLYGSTRGLAEKLMASRMIVGAHAHKLLASAKAALAEIENGLPGDAWGKFLEDFHNHAYLMGSLRGAGSEVGRALRSLQTVVKVNSKRAAEVLGEAATADEKAAAAAGTTTIEDGADEYARLLATNADKVQALKKLIDLGGDVSELSRTVREGHNTGLHRVSEATKEMMGSLFSAATGVTNTLSSLGFLGMNALGRYAAATIRSTMGLVSARQALEARRARLEAWAITEGIVGGFRPAFSATLGVLKRELLSEASLNLDGLGFENLAKKAGIGSLKAEKQIGDHFERSDVVGHKAFAMTGSERVRFDQAVDELDGPKFFKAGLKGLIRVAAGATNAAGTLYRSGTTLFVNAPDEFAGTIGTHAGAFQSAVRLAAKEAQHLGLEGKQFSEFVKARSQVLFGDGPRGWAEDGEDAGLRHVMQRAGTEEAKMVLFQDDLELGFNRGVAQLHQRTGGFGTLIVPFIKTPLRILERTAIDFTPIGLVSGRLRKAIVAGGSQRDEALARMSLGMMGIITAYNLAEDRQIVGQDGGPLSTARDAGRKSYTLKVGDDTFEFKRYDPIGTLLGFGADLREFLDKSQDDPEADGRAVEMLKGMFYATVANVLSKSWLTSIKNLADLAGATSQDDVDIRWQTFKKSMASRAVPGAGIQRLAEGWGDHYLREATDFNSGIWNASIGASKLPVKRDFLGRPMEASDSERLVGLPGGIMPFAAKDPVMAEMERLSFRQSPSVRKQKGVKLDATQFSRFLQLRGQVVTDDSGLTMEKKLKALIQSDGYKGLPSDAAKETAIRSAVSGYSDLAAGALTKEDPNYAQARLKTYIYAQSHQEGWTPEQRDQVLSQQSHALSVWLQQQH